MGHDTEGRPDGVIHRSQRAGELGHRGHAETRGAVARSVVSHHLISRGEQGCDECRESSSP
jgi:hypothetical protein